MFTAYFITAPEPFSRRALLLFIFLTKSKKVIYLSRINSVNLKDRIGSNHVPAQKVKECNTFFIKDDALK
jgi:hypothetical protein